MALFNRILVSLLALLALLLALALFAAPHAVLTGLETGLEMLRAEPALSVQLGAVIALVAVLLLVSELWPRRRRSFEARTDNMTVEYPARTVTDVLRRELVAVQGVREATAEATGDPRKIDVRARVTTEPEYDPQDVAGRAAERIRDQLERGMGLGVGHVRISVNPVHDGRSTKREKPEPPRAEGGLDGPSTSEAARAGTSPGQPT